MAPVTFSRGLRPFQPYHVSPWQGEKLPMPCPCLAPLRGDFFCLPFGGNQTPYRGECHPPHGETAGSVWTLEQCAAARGAVTTLAIALETKVRRGRVTRQLSLVDGHHAVYSKTLIEGFAGATTFGRHAILSVPEKERALQVSTSPCDLGLTRPGIFSDPRNREYQALLPGGGFSRLDQAPSRLLEEPVADCSAFPARFGYADLSPLHPGCHPRPGGIPACSNSDFPNRPSRVHRHHRAFGDDARQPCIFDRQGSSDVRDAGSCRIGLAWLLAPVLPWWRPDSRVRRVFWRSS